MESTNSARDPSTGSAGRNTAAAPQRGPFSAGGASGRTSPATSAARPASKSSISSLIRRVCWSWSSHTGALLSRNTAERAMVRHWAGCGPPAPTLQPGGNGTSMAELVPGCAQGLVLRLWSGDTSWSRPYGLVPCSSHAAESPAHRWCKERAMTLRRRAAIVIAALAGAPLLLFALPSSPASAHGTMSDPPSRVYNCWREGPESPDSAACRAAVAAGGTQALYDWNEVSLLEAGGRHQQLIPDGKLCSAGRDKYRGLALPRADWPAKHISAGSQTLRYHATAPHLYGKFTFYITRAGWSPTSSLRWSDLVQIAEYTQNNPSWAWTVNVPSRSGRHVIYSIWQRFNGSNEAFYTCSDVDFGGGGNPGPNPTP